MYQNRVARIVKKYKKLQTDALSILHFQLLISIIRRNLITLSKLIKVRQHLLRSKISMTRKITAFVSIFFLGISTASADSLLTSSCKHVHGRILTRFTVSGCDSPFMICTEGYTTGSGIINGNTSYTTLRLGPDAVDSTFTSSLSYNGYLTINTMHGDLLISDLGILNRSGGTFAELSLTLGGTGKLQNATGTLFFFGFATQTGFDGDIAGQLCFGAENNLQDD